MLLWAHMELPLTSVTRPHFELISFKTEFYFQLVLQAQGEIKE